MSVFRFFKSFSFLLALVFAFSVLTVEPAYVQGYANDDSPAFVESDAFFAVYSTEFVVPLGSFSLVETVVIYAHFRLACSPPVSDNFYRGPPTISFVA